MSGKFRKAGGNANAIHLYGRVSGTSAWTLLGTFTAAPFTASVPLTGTPPQLWEFQTRAVSKDVEFGLLSPILQQTILP